jgi:hypothetical protein
MMKLILLAALAALTLTACGGGTLPVHPTPTPVPTPMPTEIPR